MFVGEFLCCIPLIWTYARSSQEGSTFSRISKIWKGNEYTLVGEDDEEVEDSLTGWRMCWMWFPAFFDSE